jgi:precorrin-2 dehydrogenase / sirohydrochlorin ferrochelatase
MKYYPIYLNLKGRLVLLVGAGEIGRQKLPSLLKCQAAIRVVSPEALPEIRKLAQDGKITWSQRSYETADLEGASLVIAATDDPDLQKRIATEARSRAIWVNIVDVPPLCDFIAPAIVSRGDLQIAISTGGAAPALAKFLRKKLEPLIGPEYAEFIKVVDALRPDILKLPKEKRNSLWERVINDAFFEDIRQRGIAKAEARIKEWVYGDSSFPRS